jgi:glutathione peroxidase
MSTSLYDIPLTRIDGSETTLGAYEGRVLLIVNTASKCGLTPQYAGLEKAYETHRDRGFEVLGFPCNEFAGQEPGTEAEIQGFCQTQYGVQFPMFAKISVNGETRHPLYAALTAAQPVAEAAPDSTMREKLAKHGMAPKQEGDILWNFEKFLIGRDGRVLGRFAPDMTVDSPEFSGAIEVALDDRR